MNNIINTIKALMQKTVDNGCTESEAMSAAEMVAKMLRKHNLNLSEVEVRGERCIQIDIDVTKRAHPVVMCSTAIAKFTGTKVWRSPSRGKLVFFGLPHDVEVASYMVDMIRNIMEQEYSKYERVRAW